VDEMGSHSVMPSTTPIKMAFNISKNIGFLLKRAPRLLSLFGFCSYQYTILYAPAHAECEIFPGRAVFISRYKCGILVSDPIETINGFFCVLNSL
jgi:hypothetical protein